MEWRHVPLPRERISALGRELGVSDVLAELLLRVPMASVDEARAFLDPRLSDLIDPFRLPNLEAAADRLDLAVQRGEAVSVFGDYDVDGVTSTSLLVSVLRRLGLQPHYVVPRRLEEGYGMSREAIDRTLERGRPALFLALDCGTNAVEETAYLRSFGIDVIIVDHHRSRSALPVDCILVNPHVQDDAGSVFNDLCTVGLVFKVAHGLLKKRRDAGDPRAFAIKLRDYLDLVAMGTVADLVPLVRENRILASHGLRILGTTARCGLRQLMEVSGMTFGEPPRPVDVSFRLGPRINASGRLADAAVSVDLLLSEDGEFCRTAAAQLETFNRERQEIEREITERAFREIETQFVNASGVALFHQDWHPGVVGVVASRLTRKLHRPCIVLGAEGTLAKGSGRSIPGLNLVEILAKCGHLLESWGGHPMAVGVSMQARHVAEFQRLFNEAVASVPVDDLSRPSLDIAAWIGLDDVRERLLEDLDRLHPFGQHHPEPVFGIAGVIFDTPPEVFKTNHFRFQLHTLTGRRIFGVAWHMHDNIPPAGRPVDIAFQLQWNRYNGRRFMQMELHGWRLSQAG
ncbi:MAG: single-stranded-DNA-specific exonuclease RecJ [Opitutaceae bacterium]